MFESLTDRFDAIFTRLRGRGRLSEADIEETLREIRVALLEADVNFRVVRDLVGRIKQRCLEADLSKSLTPAQQVIKIVHEELVATLGGESLRITYAPQPPTVVLMAGLQGSGKTTTSAKLARWFKQQGRNPLLVGADLQRPAAVEQLRVLGDRVGVPVFSEPSDPVTVARAGIARARDLGRDVLIVDTAGRLHIDTEMMEQVRQVSQAIGPHFTFLVVDAMTGQDAVNVAESFHETLALDGVVLTKLDGDARGGAALSVKEVIGKPIAFASTGEKVEDFEQFHPDRMAGRILGMGDVMTLIERAKEAISEQDVQAIEKKMKARSLDLEVKKMGPIGNLIGMLPGLPKELRNVEIDDREIARIEAIIHSMTSDERRNPAIVNGSRRQRIAKGSGTTTAHVNQLLKQFDEMSRMMKRFGKLAGGTVGRKGKKGKKGKGATTRRGPAPHMPQLPNLPTLPGHPGIQ